MKLRNKKTEEIIDLEQWRLEYYRDSGCITLTNDRNQNEQYCYETFAGMKEDWSDCMDLEPLIENRKIRKAVRAWAEATIFDGQQNPDEMTKTELANEVKQFRAIAPLTVVREDKPQKSEEHPTMKPVRLIAKLIGNSSREREFSTSSAEVARL